MSYFSKHQGDEVYRLNGFWSVVPVSPSCQGIDFLLPVSGRYAHVAIFESTVRLVTVVLCRRKLIESLKPF